MGASTMNLYVGNLLFDVTENELKELFEPFGQVTEIRLIMDKFSGKSKGFGFIEMPSKEEAQKAIAELNGKDIKGRAMTVSEAKPKIDRGGRGGFGEGRGRGGFGRSGGGRGKSGYGRRENRSFGGRDRY
jgi:RNA recognition motif-containing protein